MGGYLQRVVESGMSSVRDVGGSIPHAPVTRNGEEQQVAAPFEGDEAVFELTRAVSLSPEPQQVPRTPSGSLPSDMTSAERDAASHTAPAAHIQPLAHRASGVASPRPPEHPSDAAWLKDAGIRSVRVELSRDEVPAATGANRQQPVPFEATVQQLNGIADDDGVDPRRAMSSRGRASAAEGEPPSSHPGVSPARLEQWTRLKDRLLIEHFPAGSSSKVLVEGAKHDVSPPANMGSTNREIVIEQLEVVVAAPHPASPTAPAPSALPARSGAWSVATRRYLGKL